jgi:hypothetical protein
MHAGLDYAAKFVLDLRKVALKIPLGMGVDNCNNTYTLSLYITHPFIMNYVASYGISDTFRTRRITALENDLVEFCQQILRQRNADSH